jgi:hypothetical protein
MADMFNVSLNKHLVYLKAEIHLSPLSDRKVNQAEMTINLNTDRYPQQLVTQAAPLNRAESLTAAAVASIDDPHYTRQGLVNKLCGVLTGSTIYT